MGFSDLTYFEAVAVYNNTKKIANNLMKKGISIEIIAEATGLSKEDITRKRPRKNESEQKVKIRTWFDKQLINIEKVRIGQDMQQAGEPVEKIKAYIKLSKKAIEESNKLKNSIQNNSDDEYATWFKKLIKDNFLTGALEVAKNMKQNNESIEKIQKYTKLSKKEIERL